MLPTIAWEVSAQQQPVARAQPAAILLEGEYVYGDVLVLSPAVLPAQHVPAFLCHDACACNGEHQRRHRLGAARWIHKLGGMRSLQFPKSDVLYRMIWPLLKNEVRAFSRG